MCERWVGVGGAAAEAEAAAAEKAAVAEEVEDVPLEEDLQVCAGSGGCGFWGGGVLTCQPT